MALVEIIIKVREKAPEPHSNKLTPTGAELMLHSIFDIVNSDSEDDMKVAKIALKLMASGKYRSYGA